MSESFSADRPPRLVPRVIWVLVIVALLAVGILALPAMMGAGRIVSSLGGWLTGYDVTVRGAAEFRWQANFFSPVRLMAEDVIVWLPDDRFTPVSSPPIARIAKVDAALSPWSLLAGRIGFTQVSLLRPGIRLDKNSDGHTNWTAHDKPQLWGGDKISFAAWPDALVETLSVKNGTFRYTDHRLARDLSFDNLNIEAGLSTSTDGTVFRLRGDANHRGGAVYSELEMRRLEDFQAGSRAPFAITIDTPLGQVHVRGNVAGRSHPTATADMELDIDNPDAFAEMIPFWPARLIGQAALRGRVDLKANRLVGSLQSLIVGKTDLSGRLALDLNEQEPKLQMTLDAGAIDAEHLVAISNVLGLVNAGGNFDAPKFKIGGGASVKWSRMILPKGELGPGGAGFSWRTGEPNLAIDMPSLQLFGGTFGGRAEMTANEGKTALTLSVTGSDIESSDLLKSGAGVHGISGQLHGNGEFLAVGESVEELLASVSGNGRISLTEGKVFRSPLQLAVDKSLRDLDLARASMRFIVEGGIFKSDELLMDFEVGHARADFEWDTVGGRAELVFQPSPIHEEADGPVAISGTLIELLAAR